VINILCDRALEIAYRRRKKSIDAAEVLSAAEVLKLHTPLRLKLASYRAVAAAALTVVMAGAVFATGLFRSTPGRDAAAVSVPATDSTSASDRGRSDPSPPNAALTPAAGAAAAEPIVAPLVAAETFAVIAASFRTPAPAADLAARASGLGLPAFTRTVIGPWHQVVVGPYATREEAQRAQAQLDAAQIRGTRVSALQPRSE
jgi:cell division septation protein DedD